MPTPVQVTAIHNDAIYRAALHGLAKMFVLHMASKRPVYGWALKKSLSAVGYHVSSGTIYPLLRSLEANGLILGTDRPVGKRMVRYYELTPEGRLRLAALRRELLGVVRDIGLCAEPSGSERQVIHVHPSAWKRPSGGGS